MARWSMFFLTRAAVCIGLVALAASNAGGAGLASAIDRGVRETAATAGQACLRSADCLAVGAGLMAAAAPTVAAPPSESPVLGKGQTGAGPVAIPEAPEHHRADGLRSRGIRSGAALARDRAKEKALRRGA